MKVLFESIGEKIKKDALFNFILLCVSNLIAAIVIMVEDVDLVGVGIAQILLGPFVLLFICRVIYGFGELIDNSTKLLAFAKEMAKKDSVKDENKDGDSHDTVEKPIFSDEDSAGRTSVSDAKRKAESEKSDHWWSCPKCGATIAAYPCGMCDYTP